MSHTEKEEKALRSLSSSTLHSNGPDCYRVAIRPRAYLIASSLLSMTYMNAARGASLWECAKAAEKSFSYNRQEKATNFRLCCPLLVTLCPERSR